jgi:sugar phosphate isomerase/epimerase
MCYPDEGESDVPKIMSDLKGRGYAGYISIEPHMAAVVHEGKDVDDAAAAADTYVEYGSRIMAIAENA